MSKKYIAMRCFYYAVYKYVKAEKENRPYLDGDEFVGYCKDFLNDKEQQKKYGFNSSDYADIFSMVFKMFLKCWSTKFFNKQLVPTLYFSSVCSAIRLFEKYSAGVTKAKDIYALCYHDVMPGPESISNQTLLDMAYKTLSVIIEFTQNDEFMKSYLALFDNFGRETVKYAEEVNYADALKKVVDIDLAAYIPRSALEKLCDNLAIPRNMICSPNELRVVIDKNKSDDITYTVNCIYNTLVDYASKYPAPSYYSAETLKKLVESNIDHATRSKYSIHPYHTTGVIHYTLEYIFYNDEVWMDRFIGYIKDDDPKKLRDVFELLVGIASDAYLRAGKTYRDHPKYKFKFLRYVKNYFVLSDDVSMRLDNYLKWHFPSSWDILVYLRRNHLYIPEEWKELVLKYGFNRQYKHEVASIFARHNLKGEDDIQVFKAILNYIMCVDYKKDEEHATIGDVVEACGGYHGFK